MKDGTTTAEIGGSPRKTAVSARNAAYSKTMATIDNMQKAGMSQRQIAKSLGVNVSLVHRALIEPDTFWSDALMSAACEQHWRTVPTRVLLPPDVQPPAELVIELRRCDVTDRYFVPTCDTQRFHPDTSPALRRAARRDLDVAREKYAKFGGHRVETDASEDADQLAGLPLFAGDS